MSSKRIGRIIGFVAIGAFALAGSVSGAIPKAQAQATHSLPQLVFRGQVLGTARFGTDGAANFSGSANTIPYWRSSFTSNGTTYPFTMVGGNPNTNSSTTVPTWIIPLKFNFSNGDSLNGADDASFVQASPMFGNNHWNSFTSSGGTTTNNLSGSAIAQQYGDAIMRTEFNKVGTGYHVLLSNQQTFPAININVPQNQGYDFEYQDGSPALGFLSAAWFSAQEHNLINQLHVPTTVVPIFLTDSVYLYIGNRGKDGCCILGWHGASTSLNGNGKQQVQTYMYAAFSRDFFWCGDASCNTIAPIADIHALSHEVSEWMNDPFINNIVPAWSVPFEPQYGCSNALETGDPLVGFSPNPNINFAPPIWHPQDIPLAPWFMRQNSAGSVSNTYTYPDNDVTLTGYGAFGFNTYSPGC